MEKLALLNFAVVLTTSGRKKLGCLFPKAKCTRKISVNFPLLLCPCVKESDQVSPLLLIPFY